jgi:metal-dependent amidase/aminoacylase/carboxypeptidase family protein
LEAKWFCLGHRLKVGLTVTSPQVPGYQELTEPTIEGGGGKIRLLDAGAYSGHGVDISLMAHPGVTPDAALVRTAAYAGMKVEYFGKEAHAAARPWEGV